MAGCFCLMSCSGLVKDNADATMKTVGNPYLPLWEHIPDGEPYVFEDPDQPGKYRVYIYGSHDSMVTGYCGREQVVWSASVDSLNNWRYDGVILCVDKNAKGEPISSEGKADVLYAPDVTLVNNPDGTKTYYLFPNDQEGGRNGLVAKSDRPDGPFQVCNWSFCSSTLLFLSMTMDGCMAIGGLNGHTRLSSTQPPWQLSSRGPKSWRT